MSRRNASRLIAAGMAGALVDGFFIEPDRLSVTRRELPCAGLPPWFAGLRVAVVADFHYRPGTDDALLDQLLTAVRSEAPDLVLLPGDFITSDPETLPPLLEFLKKLTADHGVFASMGNHDGWNANAEWVRARFEAAGISFLINQHSLPVINGRPLAVAATDHVWIGRPDPAKTLAGIPTEAPVIALVHEPDYFDTLTDHRPVTLQVSGHTHGGQCRVPLLGWAPVTPKYGTKYVYGPYCRGTSNLFVTRGFGTINPRVRFACPPELAILTLVPRPPVG